MADISKINVNVNGSLVPHDVKDANARCSKYQYTLNKNNWSNNTYALSVSASNIDCKCYNTIELSYYDINQWKTNGIFIDSIDHTYDGITDTTTLETIYFKCDTVPQSNLTFTIVTFPSKTNVDGDLVNPYVSELPSIEIDTEVDSTSVNPVQNKAIASALSNKVDKVSGKGLSTNDYTTTEKNKLANIAAGAEVNVQANWTQTTTTADDYIKNKPTLGTAAAKDVPSSGKDATASQVVMGNDTRLSDARTPKSHTHTKSDITDFPEPMVFKGSVGTSGTVTTLPTNGSATVGDTYKVITAGTYAGQAAKVGDTFICQTKTSSANTWVLIPSGDEPSGTVTSVATGTGLTGGTITSSGTISHADTSSQASVSNSGRTYIQSITLDGMGHVTALSSATETVTNTDTKVTSSANHYAPATASGSDISASASGASAAWSIDVVKGVTLNTDGKGHITGLSVTSGKIPASPTINNGTLSLKGNNTQVTSFTANQSGTSTLVISEGASNGTIKVSDGGTTNVQNVPVHGLGSAAYTNSNAYAATSHNQPASTINAMTGYSKPSSTGAISTSDTLNSAIGKLEKGLDGKGAGTVTSVATGTGLTGGTITSSGTISHADTSSQASVSNSGRTYIQSVTLDGMGHVTGLSSATETVTNTDTKVTSAANHYAPATATGSDISASATGASAAWSIDVVKGVTLNTDGKGHVTGMSVTSGKIPGNPNTDTKVTSAANHYAPTTATGSDVSASASGASAAWSIDVVKGVTLNTDGKGHVTGMSVTSGKIPANPNTDTKVTSSANHYTPSTASGSDKSASASGATAAWSIDVVKGVTLNTDGKGHVTGLSVTSGKIPANPNTDRYVNSAAFASQGTNGADGSKMTLTRAGSDTATVTATIPVATTSAAGVMSGAMVTKLNDIESEIDEIKNEMSSFCYSYKIDMSDSNPATCVKPHFDSRYGCDNFNFTSVHMDYANNKFDYGSWEGFISRIARPCMLKYNGTVDYYLNPDDYSKKITGEASDVANVNYQGNAMVELEKLYFKRYTYNGVQYCFISDRKLDNSFKCYAHHDKYGNELDYIYRACYDGMYDGTRLRSVSGVNYHNLNALTSGYIMSNTTRQEEINFAKANNVSTENGEGWNILHKSEWDYINDILILISMSTDTQTTFGRGRDSGYVSTTDTGVISTGTMNTKGLFWGKNDGSAGVKVLGIENPWANLSKSCAGWFNDKGTQKVKYTYGTEDGSTGEGFNTNASGYISITGATPTKGDSSTSGVGYITAWQYDEYGTIPYETISGASNKHLCDDIYFNNTSTCFAHVGGSSGDSLACGAFCSDLYYNASRRNWYFGAALSYKGLAA